jgi:hypothetical protein
MFFLKRCCIKCLQHNIILGYRMKICEGGVKLLSNKILFLIFGCLLLVVVSFHFILEGNS